MTASTTTPPPTSPAAPSTSPPDASSAATATKPTTTTTTPWKRALAEIDLTKLSPRSQATQTLIGTELWEGQTIQQTATKLGLSASKASSLLERLREELALQNGLLAPLTPPEYDALHDSIAEHGIQVPVVLGTHLGLIDGRHRLVVAQELGLTEVPCILLTELSETQERDLALELNTARRQYTTDQKKSVADHLLMSDPTRSDRHIARLAGLAPNTVKSLRASIQEALDLLTPEPNDAEMERTRALYPSERIGPDGRSRPAPTGPPNTPTDTWKHIAYATCTHGHPHAIQKNGDEWRLEAA